jgi:phosphoglycerate dehydrogenase-like enzyme
MAKVVIFIMLFDLYVTYSILVYTRAYKASGIKAGLFFEDHSEGILQDDIISRLLTFRNVLITSHQAFLTQTTLQNIADANIYNLDCFEKEIDCKNELTL